MSDKSVRQTETEDKMANHYKQNPTVVYICLFVNKNSVQEYGQKIIPAKKAGIALRLGSVNRPGEYSAETKYKVVYS